MACQAFFFPWAILRILAFLHSTKISLLLLRTLNIFHPKIQGKKKIYKKIKYCQRGFILSNMWTCVNCSKKAFLSISILYFKSKNQIWLVLLSLLKIYVVGHQMWNYTEETWRFSSAKWKWPALSNMKSQAWDTKEEFSCTMHVIVMEF